MVKDNNKDSTNPKLILVLIALLILLLLAGGYLAFSLLTGKEDKASIPGDKDKIAQTSPDKKALKDKKKGKSKVKTKGDKAKDAKEEGTKEIKEGDTKDKTKSTEKEDTKEIKKDDTKDKIKEEPTEEQTEEEKEETEETEEEASEPKPVKLADLTQNALKTKPEKDPNNILNQMPLRNLTIKSPFAFKKEVIQIEESNFSELQKESIAIAGKFSPFDISAILPLLNEDETKDKTSSLPEIPEIPDTISLPPGLEDNILTTGNIDSYRSFDQSTGQGEDSIITSSPPPSTAALDSARLTGVIGDSAIIDFNGESRALHVGQNHKGIVVLSISDKSVLLELNGKKVIKELRDRF